MCGYQNLASRSQSLLSLAAQVKLGVNRDLLCEANRNELWQRSLDCIVCIKYIRSIVWIALITFYDVCYTHINIEHIIVSDYT